VLTKFVDVAAQYGDTAFVDRCETEAVRLRQNIELHGWDEPKVIVRFWIAAIVLVLLSLSTLKLR